MARGEHPRRTPVYGAALVVAAMVLATAVTVWTDPPVAVRAVVLVLALAMALTGSVLTLRDWTGTR